MSLSGPTYYEVLGVSPAASADEIKKRYRELARRFHPDVSKTPDAANKFKEINEANRVLSDPDARARYDSELALKARAQANFKPPPGSAKRPTNPPPRPGPQRPQAPRPASGPQRSAPNPQRDLNAQLEKLIAEAQKAFAAMRYREAELLCRQALRLSRRCVTAYEILGDIEQKRGRTDEAIALYSYALQLDRTNRSVQMKFDKLVGRQTGPTMAGNAAKAAKTARPSPTPSGFEERPTILPPGRVLISLIGLAVLVGLGLFFSNAQETAAIGLWVWDWDPNVILTLALVGGICGMIMSINGWLKLAREELGAKRPQDSRKTPIPIGIFVVPLAAVSFYGSFAIYFAIGLLRAGLSESMLRAYTASFIATAIFAEIIDHGFGYMLLWGGNIVFLFFLVGWAVGDSFRR
jgi:tetratricopeptide (TPR) repeat protein